MMLRALALLLVVANLAMFIQGRYADEGSGAAPESAAPPAVNPPRTLRLLEEVPVTRPARSSAPAGGSAARHCERFGPFDSRAEAEAAAVRAGGPGLAAEVRVRQMVEGTPDYQVYLPPLPSLDRARLRVRELQALGVDSFVIDGDGLEGAISIGLFTARERAEVRREEVSGLGYEVRIRALERTRERAEVRVRGLDAAALTPLFRALEADHPGLERTAVDCEDGGTRSDPSDRAIAPESGVT